MTLPLLEQSRAYADRVEAAVRELAPGSGLLASLPGRCAAFRASVEALAANRGLNRITVAFVGPRNAGKTTLLAGLLEDPAIRGRLPCGVTREASTRRLLWVGPERPTPLDPTCEDWLECPATVLPDLGAPCQFLDVPGFNDRTEAVRRLARLALDSAWIKVLVVEERALEAFDVQQYLEPADGAVILPVINQARSAGLEETAAFFATLVRHVPHARVRPVIVVPDFEQRGQDRDPVLSAARTALVEALREVLRGEDAPAGWVAMLAQPQIEARWRRFQSEVQAIARESLPATAAAVAEYEAAEAALPETVLDGLLGPDRPLEAMLRHRMRAILLDNTPAILFPWRLVLGTAHLIWGALDRLPLLLMGSLPGWISAGRAAVRNAQSAADLDDLMRRGLRQQLEQRVEAALAPRARQLYESLRADLRQFDDPTGDSSRPAATDRSRSVTVEVEGIATLQERSSTGFLRVLEAHAPARYQAVLAGWLGCGLFWGVFGWPVYALYLEYGRAVGHLLEDAPAALARFPANTFAVLGTALLLALLPMGLLLLLLGSWWTRRGRVRRCRTALQRLHAELLGDLTRQGILRLRADDPALTACRQLLGRRA